MNPISASTQAGSHPRCPVLEAPLTGRLKQELPGLRPPRLVQQAFAMGSHSQSGQKISPPSSIRSISLSGPAGRLEAVLNQGASDAPYAALVCHPHPVFGGTLHNKVVYHAMKALNHPDWGLGWPVLRFNFRGAGLSEGAHDGKAEAGDVLAALDWLKNEFQRPLVVAGFSFGAAMALRACSGLDQGKHFGPGCPRCARSHRSRPAVPSSRIRISLFLSPEPRNPQAICQRRPRRVRACLRSLPQSPTLLLNPGASSSFPAPITFSQVNSSPCSGPSQAGLRSNFYDTGRRLFH